MANVNKTNISLEVIIIETLIINKGFVKRIDYYYGKKFVDYIKIIDDIKFIATIQIEDGTLEIRGIKYINSKKFCCSIYETIHKIETCKDDIVEAMINKIMDDLKNIWDEEMKKFIKHNDINNGVF